MTELKFDREATINRLLAPIPKPTKPTPLGEAMNAIQQERELMRSALEHISKTSNNYESKYAQSVLEKLDNK